MVGKVLNVCGELPERTVLSGSDFKAIVSGEPRDVEGKNTAIFTYHPKAAQWFASNVLPKTFDTSEGFTRRWLIFEFSHVLSDKEKIVDYHKILVSEEREAIAAWAVEGLQRLLKQRTFTTPISHTRRVEEMVRSNNSVASFIAYSEAVSLDKDSFADARGVYDQYRHYMQYVVRGNGVSFERFRHMLRELGLEQREYNDGVGVIRFDVIGLKLHEVLRPV